MPIKADYTWNEKKDSVKILIPLKGVSPAKVDILGKFIIYYSYLMYLMLFIIVSGRTLKVNFNPYILDLLLYQEVDSLKHRATVKDGILQITLFKKLESIWGIVELEEDTQTSKLIKEEAIKSKQELDGELVKQRTDRKLTEEKHALRQQMALDETHRNRLETIKQEEKAEAEKEVYETFAKLTASQADENLAKPQSQIKQELDINPLSQKDNIFDKIIQDFDKEEEEEEEERRKEKMLNRQKMEETLEIEDSSNEIKYVPPPRSTNDIPDSKYKINFTPRYFPTPMRESKAAEEEDWIAKNRRHLKNHGVLGKHVTGNDVSEEDPVWLKAKGDDFFRSGDYKSALNAYSAAIDSDENFIACYSNRAACYLKLLLYPQCKLDCDHAIKLVDGELIKRFESNPNALDEKDQIEKDKLLANLVKQYLRRGSSLCHMGHFQESLSDYFQALVKYQLIKAGLSTNLPNISIESIEADINRLKVLSNLEKTKKEADNLVADNNLTQALEKYDKVLEILPIHVSALSNRSACKIALGKITEAVLDCELAIRILTNDSTNDLRPIGEEISHEMKSMLSAIIPAVNSDKHKQWILKTRLRKAICLVQLSQINEAIEEYKLALVLDPKNEKLQSDLDSLVEVQKSENNTLLNDDKKE